MTFAPALTVPDGPDLVARRSAERVMVVVADAESLAGTSSEVDDDTRTLLTSDVEVESGGTVAVMVMFDDAPLAIVPTAHVTTCPVAEHDVPGGDVALTNVRPAGNVSTTETPFAAFGPLLVTVIGYWTEPPAFTDVGDDDLATRRSARSATGVVTTLPVYVKLFAMVRAVAQRRVVQHIRAGRTPIEGGSEAQRHRGVGRERAADGGRGSRPDADAHGARSRHVLGDVTVHHIGLGAVVDPTRAGRDDDRAGDVGLVRLEDVADDHVVGEVRPGVGQRQLVLQRVADLGWRVVLEVGHRLGDGVERRGVEVDLRGHDARVVELPVRPQLQVGRRGVVREHAVGHDGCDVDAEVVRVVGIPRRDVHTGIGDARVEEVGRRSRRIAQLRVVQEHLLAGEATVALPGDEADGCIDGAAGGGEESGHGDRHTIVVSRCGDVGEAFEDRQISQRSGRVTVRQHERPAGVAVGAGGGLDVGHPVPAVARCGDCGSDIDRCLIGETVGPGQVGRDGVRGRQRGVRFVLAFAT